MLAIQHLPPGTRIRLHDGSLAEVHENPHDGTWLVCQRLPLQDGAEDELIIVDDIAEVLVA
jgi:hypothetical protein